ncbi:MAG: hypothetical protein IKF50_02585 [Clostridia bacterium]|nr:hypothetical protein [Clostridia bacterium]
MCKKVLSVLCALIMLLSLFAGCAKKQEPQPAAETPQAQPAQTETAQAETEQNSQVATAEEMTEVVDVVEEGMVPVYPDELVDGTYDVEMASSSSMFKADHVQLVVENGQMYAVLYMTSKAYLYMFPGTAEEAAAADEKDYIPLVEQDEETGTFTLPVEALDAGIPAAAFSKRKEKWYDRTLLFRADSLPDTAFVGSRTRGTKPEDLGLEDGTYSVDVLLEGGSGRASVASPAQLTVKDGVYTARIEWSSDKYDFMVVNGTQYDPVNTEGNSVFEIPVTVFDWNMAVQADTTAMSQPHLIDYTLFFDSGSITPAQ